MDHLPEWLANLAEEDLAFIKNFVLSYPTMRLRLDRLIEKIRLNDNETEDPFILLVKSLAIDDRYDVDTARILIDEYRKRRDES